MMFSFTFHLMKISLSSLDHGLNLRNRLAILCIRIDLYQIEKDLMNSRSLAIVVLEETRIRMESDDIF